MGAWSVETFGNDTACDWIGNFLNEPGFKSVSEALEAVLDENDYLDSDIACEALAACEVIARMKGNWGVRDSYSEEIDKWIEDNPQQVESDIVEKAEATIAKIIGDNSELVELWDEGGKNETWHSKIDDLSTRIKG